ncbi:MAG: hypothetical protein KIG81_08640, partial [Thermoguttaceae bacterium]|nr:hypothetical protein [Thermoguttaceae bacterium]
MNILKNLLLVSLCIVLQTFLPVCNGQTAGEIEAPNNDLTGAVANVLDFGAKGDGTTDNTEAFQKALDSIDPQGGVVVVPNGQYLFTGSLVIPQSVTLRG